MVLWMEHVNRGQMVTEFKLELTRALYVIEINFMLDDEEIFARIRNL